MVDWDNLDEYTPEFSAAMEREVSLGNLGIVAPHKAKYYNRYSIDWLIGEVKAGTSLKYATFWQAEEGKENNRLSQWYQGRPFVVNGRSYLTAEQYMMSEKALLFGDLKSYAAIMQEPDPGKCKKLGRGVSGFDSKIWDDAAREIVWHGSLGKLQSDIEIVDALLSTGNAVLIEASPYDDVWGAGMKKENLLNVDGGLKVPPQAWHKAGSTAQAKNHLGFILMAVRDLYNEMMGRRFRPGMETWKNIVGPI